MTTDVKHPDVSVTLAGEDGNAFAVMGRVTKAMRRAAAPNGRDYYPQGDGAYEAAVAAHEDRVAFLRGVLAEVDAEAAAIVDAAP